MWLTGNSLVRANRSSVIEMEEEKGGRASCFVTTSDTPWAVTWCPTTVGSGEKSSLQT